MNKLIAIISLILIYVSASAQTPFKGADYMFYYQVNVGKTNGSVTTPSAWLEVGKDSTNKGLRVPRVVDTVNVTSPIYGLIVYQIKDNFLYFRDKVSWKRIADQTALNQYLLKSDSTTYYPYWSNPRNYISTEVDPVASAKTVRWIPGEGIEISNSAAQPLSSNPVATISALYTTALWNANALQGTPIEGIVPTVGQFLSFNGTRYVPTSPPIAGTVNSVGLALPSSVFDITGSPITNTGTLTGSFKNQLANLHLSSPNGISGQPSFRPLANADLPMSGVVNGFYGSDTTVPRINVNDRGIVTSATNVLADYVRNRNSIVQSGGFSVSDDSYVLGKLGIGSTTPAYKLGIRDTSSNVYSPVISDNNRPVGAAINIFNPTIKDGVGTYMIFSGKNAIDNAQQSFIGAVSSSAGYGSHFIIGQATGAASYEERMRIDSSGNVGIGITTPQELLHVDGNIIAGAPSYTTGGFTPLVRNNTTGRFEIGSVGGSGTVTSVALSAPSEFSVSGSPVTSAGTLTLTKTNQSANIVYAGPSSGGATAPTFRALVADDIPALDAAKITTGTFPIIRGGTGLSSMGTSLQQIRVNSGATSLEYFTPTGTDNYVINGRTGDYTILASDQVVVNGDNTPPNPTFTLPSAATAGAGKWYFISTERRNGNLPVTLSQTIYLLDGTTTTSQYPGNSILIISDGSNWRELNNAKTPGDIRAISSNTTLLESDYGLLCDGSSSSIDISLPPAANFRGRVFFVKRIDNTIANTLNIVPDGSETIDGASAFSTNVQWKAVQITSDGSNWFIIASNP